MKFSQNIAIKDQVDYLDFKVKKIFDFNPETDFDDDLNNPFNEMSQRITVEEPITKKKLETIKKQL